MTQASSIANAGTVRPSDGMKLQRNLALWMLFLVGTINFVDRQLLAVLVEPIRAELHFNDKQFALLTGLAFALFYAAMGIPAAMLADRWNRIRVVGVACLIWSVFTAGCGMASSFAQLAIMRFGVGTGEAGGTAPSVSIISDYFPPERRAFAIALFTCNGPFGVFLGAALGSWAAIEFGWRGAFIAIGLIGIVVAPLLMLLVKEPPRGQMDGNATADKALPVGQALALFWQKRSLRWLMLASGLAAFVSYGMLNWIPAFLMRTQGMPLSAVGTYFGPAAGITFGIGMLGGGGLVSRLAATSPRAYATIPALCSLVVIPSFAAALMVDSWQWSLVLLLVPMAACTAYVAPALALVQNLIPSQARATAAATLLLMFNIVGLAGGPFFIGAISDMLKPEYGDASLRWALMAILPVVLAAAAAQFAMGKHLEKELTA